MKGVLICLSLILLSVSVTNTRKKDLDLNPENKLFIITLDGFRWEELFRGADRKLISDPELADTTISKALYWSADPAERRQKLMPFFWGVISRQGELYGNRDYK